MSNNYTITEKVTALAATQNQIETALRAGAAAGALRSNPDPHGASFTVVPVGWELVTPPVDEAPASAKTLVKLRDAASFVAYWRDHAVARSRIYAQLDPARFLAVFDDHATVGTDATPCTPAAQVDWREYRADFTLPASREWLTWTRSDRKPMKQIEFAEFLQDNLPDVAEPDGAALLELALRFETAQNSTFIAHQRLRDGNVNLVWKVEGASNQEAALPEHIIVSIPVFENEEPTRVTARLRYRVKDGTLSLWYELVRPHKALEAAFRAIWARIAEHSPAPILLGSPE